MTRCDIVPGASWCDRHKSSHVTGSECCGVTTMMPNSLRARHGQVVCSTDERFQRWLKERGAMP